MPSADVQTLIEKDWSLSNMPPEGHPDVPAFFYNLYLKAHAAKKEINFYDRVLEEQRFYRNIITSTQGNSRTAKRNKPYKDFTALNFFFANIQRTVANLTAKPPTAEVVSADGTDDDLDEVLNYKMTVYNNESEYERSLYLSSLNMEISGVTIEKSYYDLKRRRPDMVVKDLFAVHPCPGYWEDIAEDCPYVADAYPMAISAQRDYYDVKKDQRIEPEELYNLMGEERHENNPIEPSGTYAGSQNYQGNTSNTQHPTSGDTVLEERSLVVEVWVRDTSGATREQEIPGEFIEVEDEEGNITQQPVSRTIPKYPGDIRVVTVGNGGDGDRGKFVLADQANPNINPALDFEKAKKSFLFNRLPFFLANSYIDTNSIWGFSIYEQTKDILLTIDDLFSRMITWMKRVTAPPLVVPKDCLIPKESINNKPNLVLMPPTAKEGQGIRYVQVHNLPSDFWNILNSLISFFDRISQIEDADRGVAPNKVIAHKAIAALQERGAVLVRAKIRAIDYLVRSRGRCAISHFQNFHTRLERVKPEDKNLDFIGTNFAGREFNYVVESGSTVFKTAQAEREEAYQLWKDGAFGAPGSPTASRSLFDKLDYKDGDNIVERMAEDQLEAVGQILVQAGVKEQTVAQILEFARQDQGGPGDKDKPPTPAEQPPEDAK